jgi:hypothetical protein
MDSDFLFFFIWTSSSFHSFQVNVTFIHRIDPSRSNCFSIASYCFAYSYAFIFRLFSIEEVRISNSHHSRSTEWNEGEREENIEKRPRAFFLYMRTRKKNIGAKKKKELFITIFRISIQRVYYNDAFTPYDAQSLNSLCVVSHHYSGNEKCTRSREKKGRWCFVTN